MSHDKSPFDVLASPEAMPLAEARRLIVWQRVIEKTGQSDMSCDEAWAWYEANRAKEHETGQVLVTE
ncbi:MAG: hypothetical protein GY926_24545 [bacterium]|nr:hypothetical protein [bacterium]